MDRAELSQALRPWRSKERGTGSREAIMLTELDPVKFMIAFADAIAGGSDIFLCDPKWGSTERTEVKALFEAGLGAPKLRKSEGGWLMIPTGGTAGQLKFARHDAQTIAAAVHGFTRHFGLTRVNAAGLLPLHHVSGLMAWMRCALTGGEYQPLDWKLIESGQLPDLPVKSPGWTISLVPTQLERLLRNPAAVTWLKKFLIIFIGGGPAWPELLERAAALHLPLSLGYGMTESAAMVVALRPDEFLSGIRSVGTVLPHATLKVSPEGAITLGGESLFRGYYPAWREAGNFETSDIGSLDPHGHLHISGRRDRVIISGGEKINPAEVEAVLRGSGQFSDVVVLGVPHAEWGEAVTAAYPASPPPNQRMITAALQQHLAPAKHPKSFIPLETWPVNAQGKVNRLEVARQVARALLPGPQGK